MKYQLIALLSVLSVLPWPIAGWTEGTTYQFKGASFDLPTPKGFCIPDPSNRYDANLVKGKTAVMSNSGNRLVKLVAACNELKQPDFPYDFILYYYPVSSDKESLTGTTQSRRKTLCDDFRKPYDPHAKSLYAVLNSKYQNPSESQKNLLLLQTIAAELDSKNRD